jgi:hypothetical protein
MARGLGDEHSLAMLELDIAVWEPGMVAVPRPREAIVADVGAFLAEYIGGS